MSPSSLAAMMGKMDCGLQTSNGLDQREGIFSCIPDHISNLNFSKFVAKIYFKSVENYLMKEFVNNCILHSFKGRIILGHAGRKDRDEVRSWSMTRY